MKIYLAARYSRRLELCDYRMMLESIGVEVTARWLNGSHQLSDTGVPISDIGEALVEDGDGPEAAQLRAKFTTDDYDDVMAADLIIAFTQPPRTDKGCGGRHVEFGIALGSGKPIIVIGPRENFFCWLPQIQQYDTWDGFLTAWHLPELV
jgi:nucleoside 2-deoxyribosyltransferase